MVTSDDALEDSEVDVHKPWLIDGGSGCEALRIRIAAFPWLSRTDLLSTRTVEVHDHEKLFIMTIVRPICSNRNNNNNEDGKQCFQFLSHFAHPTLPLAKTINAI